MRNILRIDSPPAGHWVGDGFPVRSLLSHRAQGDCVSPFLLLDYAGPTDFPPATTPRGVGAHPHRGFETVTLVLDGEIAHRDSAGAGGVIGPGDVQWMTAGAGLLHEEMHTQSFTRSGGRFEVVQLWVNLPAAYKLTAPRYQTLLDDNIPRVELPNDAGLVRVIAGDYGGHRGPAQTHTPINIWDVRLDAGATAALCLPERHSLIIAALDGALRINHSEQIEVAELVVFDREGGDIVVSAQRDTKFLLLSGEPIDEPVVQQGPFVMNTMDEVRQALADYRDGVFGVLPDAAG